MTKSKYNNVLILSSIRYSSSAPGKLTNIYTPSYASKSIFYFSVQVDTFSGQETLQ